MSIIPSIYKPKNKIRIVTAGSLFDGHDAAINIMRRILQSSGAEIIHLGHNRSADEIVNTAIQEDVQAIAITSYQGGHNEFFKYIYDLLHQRHAGHIKVFGGGGGTILPEEIAALQAYGIARIYSPDNGRSMGLQGMINDVLENSDFPVGEKQDFQVNQLNSHSPHVVARMITAIENYPEHHEKLMAELHQKSEASKIPVVGITGTGGAGKSSLIDELIRRFLLEYNNKTLAIISVDPSKRKSGGALLGDRIRMNAVNQSRIFMRSRATRQSNRALSSEIKSALDVLKAAGFDLIILETSGIGQADTEITEYADMS
ncbi:MAG TPA: cobalamin-dependent protein, partial [Saprospiraceae bacterium]|nr:cobalamin-dependent protein [Saprospiraceae bacterium]